MDYLKHPQMMFLIRICLKIGGGRFGPLCWNKYKSSGRAKGDFVIGLFPTEPGLCLCRWTSSEKSKLTYQVIGRSLTSISCLLCVGPPHMGYLV